MNRNTKRAINAAAWSGMLLLVKELLSVIGAQEHRHKKNVKTVELANQIINREFEDITRPYDM